MPADDTLPLASARLGDPAAWDVLLKRHQLPLFVYATELIHDRTAALDVVQETFTAAVRHIAGLRDDARFGAWLFGIAHQKCLQHLRLQRRAETVFAPTTESITADEQPDLDTPDARAILLQREQAEAFFSVVARLPEAQRAALLLHVIEEFSLGEIATITGVPLGTVKSRLHHAKRLLRRLLAAQP